MACALLACGAAVAQTETHETLYVIEQVVVSVNATADGSGDRIGQIHSGDRVEVLEREGDQSHVRLASGEEGWVRSSYLSASPPLREQLKTRTEELEKLRQENTKLEADLASARKAASAAGTASAAATLSAASLAEPPATASAVAPAAAEPMPPEAPSGDSDRPNPPLFSAGSIVPSRPSWVLALVGGVAALVIGFVLGWRMLDRRIRAKYGGLRIY